MPFMHADGPCICATLCMLCYADLCCVTLAMPCCTVSYCIIPCHTAQVRVVAAGKVSIFSKYLTPQLIIQHIMPCVRELSLDSRCVLH